MKDKLHGIYVFLVLFAWLFTIDVTAQKNEQLLLKKKEAVNNISVSNAVLDEINNARQNPQRFINYLEDYRKKFNGLRFSDPNGKSIKTAEGVTAVDEAIEFLRNLSPLEPLQMNEGLNKSANLQLGDLTTNPALEHIGADGSSFDQRIERFGKAKGKLGENIAFRRHSAREIVLLWIIDDGISSRLHRLNIFDSKFKIAGVAYGKGIDDKGLCVLVLAGDFSEKGKPQAIEMF